MANLTYERVSVKFAVLVVVHLDTRLVVIDALGNDAEAGEDLEQFFLVNVLGKRSDVNCCVDALPRLVVLGFLCVLLESRSVGLGSQTQQWIDIQTHILSLDSLALLGRVKRRLLVVDARHLVRRALLLCKRFIHLYHEKSRKC